MERKYGRISKVLNTEGRRGGYQCNRIVRMDLAKKVILEKRLEGQ